MALDRLTQITSSGISSTSTITVSAIAGVVTATRATVGSGITLSDTQINVGSATTIHSGGFRIGSSDLHSTGITLNNINASGIITSSGGIVVGTGGTIITTTSGGNIGVGTTNPGSNKVEIVGNDGGIGLAINNNVALSFKDSSGIARRAALLSPSSTYYYGDVDNAVSGSTLYLLANTNTNFFINGTTRASVSSNGITVGAGGTIITTTASGLVGVGTTNPSSTIDILGLQANTGSTSASLPTGTLKLGFDGGAVGGTYGSSLVFSQRWFSATSAQVAVGQIAGFKSGGDGNFGGGLAFFTSDTTNNNLAERLRITSTGTIGIGTSTPSNKVSIGVGTPATLNTTSEGLRVTDGLRNVQLLRTGSSYSYGGLGGTASLLYSYDSLFLQADTSNPIVFSTGSAETARITPAGLIQTPNNIGGGLDIGYKKSVTITGSFAANTWYNTGIDRTTDNGIYLLCAYVDTYNTGQSYQMNYIGWFVLPNRATNSGATSAITLHSAGHAPNAEVIQFRTLLEPAVSGGRIYLQWLSNFALTLNGGGGNNIQVAIHRLGTAFNS